ncbi:DUF6247 family protein [Nonomuraea sp. NPDC048916]|uniref:DUF6247 family protein n=1 Tax=Nonomuraea sp. NPDC048916 TaxID=3154232 RepID=UPI0033C69BDC
MPTLPAIREALSHPRDREGLDWQLPAAVEEARAAGNWKPVDDFTHRWWIVACDSMQHPEGRQQTWDAVDDIRARVDRGEPLPEGRPFDEVIAEIAAKRGIELPTLGEIRDRRRSRSDG